MLVKLKKISCLSLKKSRFFISGYQFTLFLNNRRISSNITLLLQIFLGSCLYLKNFVKKCFVFYQFHLNFYIGLIKPLNSLHKLKYLTWVLWICKFYNFILWIMRYGVNIQNHQQLQHFLVNLDLLSPVFYGNPKVQVNILCSFQTVLQKRQNCGLRGHLR